MATGSGAVQADLVADQHLREIFDEDAQLYDRARPGYPEELLDDLVDLAGLGAGSRVLEIGPGTGQATLALAGRGCSVLAVELGASLATTLRRRVEGLPVEVSIGSFEDQPLPTDPFDAVAAFTAWHWLTPDLRVTKAHAALRPGGSLVTVTTEHVFGGTAPFFADAQRCYERWDPATEPGLRLLPSAELPPVVDEVDASELFAPAVRRRYHREVSYSTGGYLEVLSTYSGHRALTADQRTGLLDCIGQLIDTRYGGTVTKRYLYELRVAQRSRA